MSTRFRVFGVEEYEQAPAPNSAGFTLFFAEQQNNPSARCQLGFETGSMESCMNLTIHGELRSKTGSNRCTPSYTT